VLVLGGERLCGIALALLGEGDAVQLEIFWTVEIALLLEIMCTDE
jgi:hypothetical protein